MSPVEERFLIHARLNSLSVDLRPGLESFGSQDRVAAAYARKHRQQAGCETWLKWEARSQYSERILHQMDALGPDLSCALFASIEHARNEIMEAGFLDAFRDFLMANPIAASLYGEATLPISILHSMVTQAVREQRRAA